MSSTGPDEGTLRVLSMLRLAIPYIIMRPFFRLNENDANEWVVDLDNSDFPGSLLGAKQSLTTKTHPHLRLDKTMVAIPPVNPGDQGPDETKYVGRTTSADVKTLMGRRAFGLEQFVAIETDDPRFIQKVNDMLFDD
ncbi:hypothetical protein C0989_007247 [Termitomyces sp. Mn162]|nr:hypothetical protein C0989_007247 [Termitomyces sp. Mn162]